MTYSAPEVLAVEELTGQLGVSKISFICDKDSCQDDN